MSNTSYSFKENSHVIVNQGGEKKVMKKILSVALSTAMAFSMFASVAFGADAKLTDQQQFDALKQAGIVNGFPDGQAHLEKALTRAELAKIIVLSLNLTPVDATSYKDKNYANHWGRTYIEAATQAGILNGKDATKKLFDPNGNVTVQELAKVLVTALKLEVPADANNSASEWAKGYVAAAIKAGYIADGINYQAQATRSQAVVAAYAIYEAAQVPTVASYTVAKDGKSVEFTLSNKEVVKVDVTLEPNKATEVTFKTKDGVELKHTVTWVVTEATKVQSVSADNLKEVVVTFDGEVDKTTAELKDNYRLSGGLTVGTAVLNDAKNAVTLTLAKDQHFSNQVKYNLTLNGVKAGTKTLSASNIEFSPVDNKLPEVVSVTGLGTKAVKIVFSEPVKQSYTGSFLLDGNGFYGTPSIEGRELVLRASSDLPVGEHTLSVAGVEDFAGFKSLKSEHKFTVVEDTTAPTISEVEATLEKVTITFSEDIDTTTIDTNKIYHKKGDSKITAASTYDKLAGNKFVFYFNGTDKALPSYETLIYVEGVKDYSGNEIKETSKLITAKIDTERPTVVDARVNADADDELIITFSKPVAIPSDFSKAIVVKDKDGKVSQIKTVSHGKSSNILVVKFFAPLKAGSNTLTINGIRDNTVLGNVLIDYNTTFTVGDKSNPTVTTVSYTVNRDARRAVVVFDKVMDAASLQNKSNYVLNFNNKLTALPSDANVTVIQGGKAVVIELPVQINGVDVYDVATGTSRWTGLTVQGLKDTEGNFFAAYKEDLDFSKYRFLTVKAEDGKEAKLTGTKEVKVKLSQAVSRLSAGQVKVNSLNVEVTANDTDTITLKLASDVYDARTLNIDLTGAKFIGVAQNEIGFDGTTTIAGSNIKDEVKPVVQPLKDASDREYFAGTRTATSDTYLVNINVSEELDVVPSLNHLYATDLVVTRLTDNEVVPVNTAAIQKDFSFEVVSITNAGGKATIQIRIKDAKGGNAEYSIAVKSDAKYLIDASGNANVIASKDAVRTALIPTP